MKKLIIYSAIVFFSFFWFLGCSKTAVDYLTKNNFIYDDFRYGDLYRFSNLKQFKKEFEVCALELEEIKNGVHLHLAGDSFLDEKYLNNYKIKAESIDKYTLANPENGFVLKSGKNILILETVERHFSERFLEPYTKLKPKSNLTADTKKPIWEYLENLEIPYKEDMHISAIFGFDFFLYFKELKASLNHKIFNRVNDNVSLSLDNNKIYYSLDFNEGSNSFSATPDSVYLIYKNGILETIKHYKALGFDEVYVSVIPNKSTIFEFNKGKSSYIFNKLQEEPELKPYLIDVYTEFSENPNAKIYQVSDSHWDCGGIKIWIDKVNAIIAK